MTLPWFSGAWRRDGIEVPGGERVEPCEAWWLQSQEWFVDVRRVVNGPERNGLPYSQTRVMAGRFWIESDDRVPCWEVLIDSTGSVPRLDRGAPGGLWIDPDDPAVMVEDAPGRFREWWVRSSGALGEIAVSAAVDRIEITIGQLRAAVWSDEGVAHGTVWRSGETVCTV